LALAPGPQNPYLFLNSGSPSTETIHRIRKRAAWLVFHFRDALFMDTALLVAKTPAEARLVALLEPSALDMGYEIVRLRLMGAGMPGAPITLQIMAEKPDGTMEIDDCAALSQAVSAIMDVEDPIEKEYALEVSSPGIDRPLTRAKDFAEYAGHRAKVEMSFPVEGGRRNFRGDLRGLEGDAVSLALDDGPPVSLALRDIADAKLVITDKLIEESLKRKRVPDAGFADEIEYEDATDESEGPAKGSDKTGEA